MRFRYGLCFVLLSLLVLPQTLYAQALSVTQPNWFLSPFNWNIVGTAGVKGVPGGPGSPTGPALVPSEAVTTQPGAYFTLSFANSSKAVLNIDMVGVPVSGGMSSMAVQWSIDNTLYPLHPLSVADAQLTLATGLTSGPHTIQFWFVSSDYHQDRWGATIVMQSGFVGPAQSLRVTGITLDPGASLSAQTSLRPKRILFFGDSITEGAVISPNDDASQTYAVVCAHMLNAEYGVVANPGQGFTCNIAPTSGVPAFDKAFTQHYAQNPRFPQKVGLPDPDYVILNMGTNDAITGALPDGVTAQALAWIQQMRSDLPASQIFLLVPFGGFYPQALQAACSQYLLAHPTDTKVGLLNLGQTAQTGLMAQIPGGTAQSFDGIHPNIATHRALGCQLTAAIQTAMGRNDFSGDGKSDLILQNIASNQIALWFMNGTTLLGGGLTSQTPSSGYKVVGVGDFNGDGKPDLVFQNQTTHQIAIWFMDGTQVIGGTMLDQAPAAGWHVVGTADFNRDGQNDLLFQNDATGTLVIWYLNGAHYVGGAVVTATPAAGYRVESIADFDGDGRPDLMLRDANGNIALWHLDDANVFLSETLSLRLDPAFRIVGSR